MEDYVNDGHAEEDATPEIRDVNELLGDQAIPVQIGEQAQEPEQKSSVALLDFGDGNSGMRVLVDCVSTIIRLV